MSPRTRTFALATLLALISIAVMASAWRFGGIGAAPPEAARTAPRAATFPALPSSAAELAFDALPSSGLSITGHAALSASASANGSDASTPATPPRGAEVPAPPAPEEPAPPAPAAPEEPASPAPAAPEEPASPTAPGAVIDVACTSGDMQDMITFAPPTDGGPVSGYALYFVPADAAPTLVATADAEATSFTVSVSDPSVRSYRVSATGAGGEGPFSETVTNALVSITRAVPPGGATLRASNGEMSLVLAAGSYATTTTVTVTETAGSPLGRLITLAGVYEISPSGPLGAPATLSVAYSSAIEHFQVRQAVLAAAKLMTYDAASGTWIEGARGLVSDGTYLTGTLSHFSYWTGATVQPHGTSTTAYCSTGPETVGGFCHNLSSYPGSATRIAARDAQVCYNCHGNPDPLGPPLGAYPDSRNIQAEVLECSFVHPIGPGGLYCTACHDPHADPAASPGLLKVRDAATGTYIQGGAGTAPGTVFCWACHGSINNKLVNYYVPGYFANSGGDKKTGFNGAHTATGTSRVRLDLPEELAQGYADKTVVQPAGTVTIAQTNIMLPKTQTPVPVPAITGDFKNAPPQVKQSYDGDTNTKVFWSRDALGATAGNGYVGTGSLTIDLGSPTQVTNFECVYLNNMSCVADVLEIQTSNDGVSWSTVVSQGTVGTHLWTNTVSLTGTGTGRYVRFVFTRDLATSSSEMISIAEISIYGIPSQGTYTVRPDITRKASFTSGVVKWQASATAPATVTASARASLNNGTTWTGWEPITNGGAIPTTVMANGSSLENALMEIQFSLSGAQSPIIDWVEVGITRGAITGTTPQWSGAAPPANQCLGCHASHGENRPGLVTANATPTCLRCHSAAYGASYKGQATFGASAHAAVECNRCHTAHGNASTTGNSYPYLLKASRPQACLTCHPGVQGGIEAKQGAASEWAKHDLYPAEQVKSGSRLACKNCHATHFSSTGLVNPDLTSSAYTTMRDDPTSIPVTEVLLEASRDTLIDSAVGQETWNYGASTQFTIRPDKRGLLYFDLSGIPADAVIQHASLVLWGTSAVPTDYTGSLAVYPATSDWLEGSGTGTPNSAGVNGATWFERRYGDNANTGDTAGGDWAVVGGDFSGTPTVNAGVGATTVTDIIKWQRTNGNYGLVLVGNATANYPIYARHATPGSQLSPRLRVWYQTGPATRQVVDDITFCTKCHDGTMPSGLSGQALLAVGSSYGYAVHGGGKGKGPESAAFRSFFAYDTGGGGLKAPYSYGMDALPCSTCHDPHGSRLPYHLKEIVNGQPMTPLYGWNWTYGNATSGGSLGYFCTACHVFPTNHAGWQTMDTGCIGGG